MLYLYQHGGEVGVRVWDLNYCDNVLGMGTAPQVYE